MTPQPPPTQEQFALLERHCDDMKGAAEEAHADALRSVLAYARLGVETARIVGPFADRRPHADSEYAEAGVACIRATRDLGLLAPAAQEEKRDG